MSYRCQKNEILQRLCWETFKHLYFTFSSASFTKINKNWIPNWQIAKVDCSVPNLLRCYRCQMFGHHEDKCNGTQLCGKCSLVGVDHQISTCTNSIKCANCGLNHATSSNECSFRLTQTEIISVKYKQNVSFVVAKRIVTQHQNTQASFKGDNSFANKTRPHVVTPVNKTIATVKG